MIGISCALPRHQMMMMMMMVRIHNKCWCERARMRGEGGCTVDIFIMRSLLGIGFVLLLPLSRRRSVFVLGCGALITTLKVAARCIYNGLGIEITIEKGLYVAS